MCYLTIQMQTAQINISFKDLDVDSVLKFCFYGVFVVYIYDFLYDVFYLYLY